ncbi:MAG: hypothetical protein JSU57_00295 [Candidatus Heimdallarchaeota archaeon]|nr:MAG: hypothetical protein JSU57_00295 [Candidatus Heimdallarchaeota archaeon]
MSIIEEFDKAFQLVDRYEEYKLFRAWGIIFVITGVARFLLGFIIWNLFYLIYTSMNNNFNSGALMIAVFNSVVSFILIFSLAVIMIYTYLSIRKTTIKDGKLISSKILYSGIALAILYFLTFILQIPGSVYWEEVIAIFICYFILKRGLKSDFKEILYLGVILFVVSIVEFIGRVFLVLYFLYQPLFTPLWIIFYLMIGFVFMIPYIITGLRIFRKGSLILEEG